jgi:hypothetical protein
MADKSMAYDRKLGDRGLPIRVGPRGSSGITRIVGSGVQRGSRRIESFESDGAEQRKPLKSNRATPEPVAQDAAQPLGLSAIGRSAVRGMAGC